MEQTKPEIKPAKPEPQMTDVGTRLEHLTDFADSLNECAEFLERKGLTNKSVLEKYARIRVTQDTIQQTLDGYLGLRDASAEYKLYQLLNTVPPKKGDEIEGGRGTPLV